MRSVALLLVLLAAPAAELIGTNAVTHETAPVLPEDRPFAAQVPFVNPHDRAVRIASIDASCTCTTLEVADRFLLPGQRSVLSVAVQNRNHSGPKQVTISLYPSDQELEAIDLVVRWSIIPTVAVDALPPGADPLQRPEEAWRDVYRYLSTERPDETHRLRKRIRLWSPPERAPEGGLRLLGIDYAGPVWRFASVPQQDGSILIQAGPQDPPPPAGRYDETVVLRTNHPDKPRIELSFGTTLSMDAGKRVGVPVIPGMP